MVLIDITYRIDKLFRKGIHAGIVKEVHHRHLILWGCSYGYLKPARLVSVYVENF